ncbi:MAG: DUF2513 domain-containing protein [Planctomycetota bacterium]|nr:DUF2513 domain-containing protein [Planctomycetota bacterium]MDA1251451.1 DUF2513 domain-containing protein [Planctomycetota bacterium]
MRRDMDLVRRIGFVLEAAPSDGIDSDAISIPSYDDEQIAYHCVLMHEAGLFDAIDVTTSASPFGLKEFLIRRLTMAGHDFVDLAREDGVWNKVKSKVAEVAGGVTIGIMVQCLKAELARRLGLSAD